MSLPLEGRRYSVRVTYNGNHKVIDPAGHQTVLATIFRACAAFGLEDYRTFTLHRTPPGEPGEPLNPSLLLYETTVCAGDCLTLVNAQETTRTDNATGITMTIQPGVSDATRQALIKAFADDGEHTEQT